MKIAPPGFEPEFGESESPVLPIRRQGKSQKLIQVLAVWFKRGA